MTPLTAPSSAEIVPFPAADRPTFAVASKAWLKTTQTHPLLTDANKTFCTALYFYFNVKHYQKTGELIAWPAWDTLMTEFRLSKETINESIGRLSASSCLRSNAADMIAPLIDAQAIFTACPKVSKVSISDLGKVRIPDPSKVRIPDKTLMNHRVH